MNYFVNIWTGIKQAFLAIIGKHKPAKTSTGNFWNFLFSLDTLLNAILGGDPQETVSSRFGKWLKQGSKGELKETDIRYRVAKFICSLIHPFEKNHCLNSINNQEGTDAVSEDAQRLVITIAVVVVLGWLGWNNPDLFMTVIKLIF